MNVYNCIMVIRNWNGCLECNSIHDCIIEYMDNMNIHILIKGILYN